MTQLRMHRLYEPLISGPFPAQSEGLRIISLKAERLPLGEYTKTFIDAIVGDGERLFLVPFMEYRAGANPHVVVPRRASVCGEPLLHLFADAAANWYRGKGEPADAVLDFFAKDDDLVSLAQDDGTHGSAVCPGLAPLGAIFGTLDRYAAAATRSHGRKVLDLRAGIGTGAVWLQQHAAAVDMVSELDLHRRVAQRMGRIIHDEIPGSKYDLVVAFGIAFEDRAKWIELAGRYHAQGSRVLLSFLGEHVEALRDYGAAERLIGAAGNLHRAYDETLLWMEPDAHAEITAAVHVASLAERKLSILFAGAPSPQTHGLMLGLRARGHNVEEAVAPPQDSGRYDIVHLRNLNEPLEALRMARALAPSASALVLSAEFSDRADEGTWAQDALIRIYASSGNENELQSRIAQLAQREFKEGPVAAPPLRSEAVHGYEDAQRELLKLTDYLFVSAYSEVHRIYRYFDPTVPFARVHAAVDAPANLKLAASAFTERHGMSDFIVIAAPFCANQNQLAVEYLLRDSSDRLILAGTAQDALYAELVRMYWPANAILLPELGASERTGAFAAARIAVFPSFNDSVRLQSLEAALCETALVLSRNGYEHEYFGADAHYFDPADPGDIFRAVSEAQAEYDDRAELRVALAQRVRSEFTFANAARESERAYMRILEDNPRAFERLARLGS